MQLFNSLDFYLNAPELKGFYNTATQTQGTAQSFRSADSLDYIRRSAADIVYRNSRSCTTNLAHSHNALIVDRNCFRTGSAQLVEHTQQIFIMNNVQIRIFTGLFGNIAVIQQNLNAFALYVSRACHQLHTVISRILASTCTQGFQLRQQLLVLGFHNLQAFRQILYAVHTYIALKLCSFILYRKHKSQHHEYHGNQQLAL